MAEGHLELSQLLLAANADVNVRDKEYQPCICTRFSNAPVMSCFIRLNTALHFSAQKGNLELSQLLLAANADVNARSQGYRPPPLLVFHNFTTDFLFYQGSDPSFLLRPPRPL